MILYGAALYSVFWLGKAAIDYFGFRDKETASSDLEFWRLTAGNLLRFYLLDKIFLYLLEG